MAEAVAIVEAKACALLAPRTVLVAMALIVALAVPGRPRRLRSVARHWHLSACRGCGRGRRCGPSVRRGGAGPPRTHCRRWFQRPEGGALDLAMAVAVAVAKVPSGALLAVVVGTAPTEIATLLAVGRRPALAAVDNAGGRLLAVARTWPWPWSRSCRWWWPCSWISWSHSPVDNAA